MQPFPPSLYVILKHRGDAAKIDAECSLCRIYFRHLILDDASPTFQLTEMHCPTIHPKVTHSEDILPC